MAVTITRSDDTFSNVVLNPPIDGSKEITINRKHGVARVTLIENDETADMVKIFMTDNEVLELHFSVGVFVDGVQATSNKDMKDKIDAHLIS